MGSGVQTQGGKILLWRLGNLEYGKQDKWARAPEARGMWAFPWPYFEMFLAYHQYRYLLPKRLQTQEGKWLPLSREWYRKAAGDSWAHLDPEDELIFDEESSYRAGVKVRSGGELLEATTEGFYDAQNQWINTVGKKVLPIRKFWYEGELYSHISKTGEIGDTGIMGGETDWHRISTQELAKVVRKTRGIHEVDWRRGKDELPARYKTSSDHLELFLPAGGGKITGYKERK